MTGSDTLASGSGTVSPHGTVGSNPGMHGGFHSVHNQRGILIFILVKLMRRSGPLCTANLFETG